MNDFSSRKKFHDLHTYGIGYLKRAREVQPKKGSPYLACNIVALIGPTDDPEATVFDSNVVGSKAKELIRQYMNAIKEGREVLAEFKLGDLWIDPFVHEDGPQKGESDIALKTRLLFFYSITVDGTLVYSARSGSAGSSPTNEEAAAPSVMAGAAAMASAAGAGEESKASTTH